MKLERLTVWMKLPRCIFSLWSVQSILIAVALLSSSVTLAVPPPEASATSATGHYVVSFRHAPSNFTWLEEKAGATGDWGRVDAAGTGHDWAANITGKTSGIYYYRVAVAIFGDSPTPAPSTYHDPERLPPRFGQPPHEEGQIREVSLNLSYSPVVAVVVSSAAPTVTETWDTKSYAFQARQGDINGDSLKDIYIGRIRGGHANDGVIYRTILKQTTTGDFEPMPATPTQLGIAAAWPLADFILEVRDQNYDGYVDVLVLGVDAVISGRLNQFVFSSGQPNNGQARVATSLSREFLKFFRDGDRSHGRPHYFDAAVLPPEPGVRVEIGVTVSLYAYWSWGWYGSWVLVRSASRTLYQRDYRIPQLVEASRARFIAQQVRGQMDSASTFNFTADDVNLSDYAGDFYLGYCNACGWGTRMLWRYYQRNRVITLPGGGFDEVNYSRKAKEFAPVFRSIPGVWTVPSTPSPGLTRAGELIEDVLGIVIFRGEHGRGTFQYPDGVPCPIDEDGYWMCDYDSFNDEFAIVEILLEIGWYTVGRHYPAMKSASADGSG